MNITTHPYPEAQSAYDANKAIQFAGISATSEDAWFDYDADSQEPPSFDSKVLKWRVKPAVLHPVFANIAVQFNSIFGGMK